MGDGRASGSDLQRSTPSERFDLSNALGDIIDEDVHTDESTDEEDVLMDESATGGDIYYERSTSLAPPPRPERLQAIRASPEVYTPLDNSEPAQACKHFAARVGMLHPSKEDFPVDRSLPTHVTAFDADDHSVELMITQSNFTWRGI